MNEDTLHDFIAAIFQAWENSIYYESALDTKVAKLNEYKKSYLELAQGGKWSRLSAKESENTLENPLDTR